MSARQSPPNAKVTATSKMILAGSWTAVGLRQGTNAADSPEPSPLSRMVSVSSTPPA
jgi:hypothetical protein